ncbi:FAD-dependent monooxygenase OpS4 [Lachnellula suecica]|uniref:FAD-dependent monooxygenase OpS4 n=1 Tax=Lachnellula suecica TaxID=602035 RepID=A0A8T9CAN7_9HELO|nr:FAD-dependent monooxygenase OpS4 [Lachnellula suecica]
MVLTAISNSESFSTGTRKSMENSLNIVICGAGIAGLGAAIALRKKGHLVTVVEAAPQLQEVGAGIQVPPNSTRILKSWGLEEKFLANIVLPKNTLLRRYATGEVVGRVDANPESEQKYGYPYWFIHRADFQKILYDAATEFGIEVIFEAPVERVREDGSRTKVVLKNGEELEADLVVGADGIRSKTRATAIQNSIDVVESSHCAFRATVPAELMKADPAIAHFMTDPSSNVWMGPDSHIVGYPIRKGEMYNLVICRRGKASVGKWNEPADINEVREHYTGWEPNLRQVLSNVTSCQKWKLAYLPPLDQWISDNGRVVIIGDAAHAMLPYMAQGAAMGIEDGAALAECVARVTDLTDLPTLLRAFQDFRKPRVDIVTEAVLSNADTFHRADGPEQEQRDKRMKQQMEGTAPKTTEEKSQQAKVIRYADKDFQPWLYGYDTIKEVSNGLLREAVVANFK